MGTFSRNGRGVSRRRHSANSLNVPHVTVPTSTFFANDITQATSASYSAIRTITAAASRINLQDKGEAEQFKLRQRGNAINGEISWQSEAWEYYDAIGEIKYAFNLVASVVSRIGLYTGVIHSQTDAPLPTERSEGVISPRLADAAQRALAALSSAYGGQPGLLRDAALNFSVVGECYLVQLPARAGSGLPESWDIRSIDELQVDSSGNYVIIPRKDLMPGASGMSGMMKGTIPLPSTAFVGRMWRAHPRFSEDADCSLKGLLDLCSELLLLNRTFRATARSRLNAGALYIPDGLAVAASPDPNLPYDSDVDPSSTADEAADDFETQLLDAMTTPIRDEDSASAVVPLIIRGPADLGDKIKQFKFERSFDPALAARADRVLERILQGIDVPKDVVTGLANVKYSNALQIDESLYKAHIEPLMLLIVDALTVMYLRPYLLAAQFTPDEVEKVCIWYDPSRVATRNDRAGDADAGYDKMIISSEAWRRAHGFSDTDAPTSTELGIRLLADKGQFSPDFTEAIMGTVAPEMMHAIRIAQQAASVAPVPAEIQHLLQGPADGPNAPGSPGTATTTAPDASTPAPAPAPDTTTPTPDTTTPTPAPAAQGGADANPVA